MAAHVGQVGIDDANAMALVMLLPGRVRPIDISVCLVVGLVSVHVCAVGVCLMRIFGAVDESVKRWGVARVED